MTRAAVLRLLGFQHFVTDLTEVLSERHVLHQGPASAVGAGRRDPPPPHVFVWNGGPDR